MSVFCLEGIIFIFGTLIIGLYFYLTRNFNYWKNRGVDEIPPRVFFGNFAKCWSLNLSPGYLLKTFYEQYVNSPYVGIYSSFDNKPCLLLRDPEIIKKILIRDFHAFSDKLMRSSEKEKLSNNCIFLIRNPAWKFFKSNLSSLFTSSKLRIMFEYLQDVRKDLDHYLDSLNLEGSGNRVNVKELCAKFTIDIVGLTVLGLKLNCLRDPNAEFQKIVKRKMTGVSNLRRALEVTSICLMPQISTLFDFRFFENGGIEFFKKPFRESMHEREKSKLKRNDLMDLLIQMKNNENSSRESDIKLDENDLLSQAMIFFLAGYDSSALTMSSTLYELARKPDIQNKLRAEINESLLKNNGKITYNMVMDLQYLEMVILETLRMYPVLPIIDRIAVSDYKIEETGLIIEKGTPILIPMLGLHYDSNYFTNPDEYDPENFSDLNKSSRNPYVFMPFGIGPRSCIGMRQGLLQSKLGILQIISKFEVSLENDSSAEIDPKGYFTLFKEDLFLRMRKI